MGRRARKSAFGAVTSVDSQLRQDVDAAFSPPVLWWLRPETVKNRLSQALADSAQRALADLPEPHALTAAVSRMSMDGAAWKNWRFGDRAWQADAWRLFDITGQLRFVANWVGSSVSRCRLQVVSASDETPANPDLRALSEVPFGGGNGLAEALRLLGMTLFVPGEAYIVAESGVGTGADDMWWVVTARQIRRQGDRITIKRPQERGGGIFTYRDGIDLIIRCWTPHPNGSDEPDSPTRSAIPDLREMEALRKREFAELDSRLSGAGILALPEGMELPRGDSDPAGATGFSALLSRTMAQSLRDRTSAEAMVPIIITGPAEDLAAIRHITMWSELSDHISSMRESALRSLAQSLDVPPEVLLGVGGTNHWNAWAISREAVQIHIKPILVRIAHALTEGFLQPALEALGEDPHAYKYVFDVGALTTNPDRSADAMTLHDRLLLSDEVALESFAWNGDDMPSAEELAVRLVQKLLLASPDSVLGDPALRSMLNLPPAQTTAPSGAAPGPTEPEPAPDTDQPPEESPAPPDTDQPPGLALVTELAIRRCLAQAGRRIVPHSRRPGHVPAWDLHTHAATLTPAQAQEMVRQPWRSEFGGTVNQLGIDPDYLIDVVEQHCAALLSTGAAYTRQDVHDIAAAVHRGRNRG